MPSYDLICQTCNHKFSVFCSISQKDRQVCPVCGSDQIKQRFTTINVMGKSSSGGSSIGSSSGPQRFG
ncbi:zinc ribbon domain protein [Desulfosporosinus acididurans]|uniref:Zinc ribbon domain protein n=1 Tax=Desulfosporosinus acididurans TaxID=476652 RepID=A0A0J1INB3_9FIRM|nr:zinc ribbon domain protein [Desulfosporosinus acididurans]